MEDAGGQHRVGLAVDDALGEVLELAHAAAGDDGDVHRARHRAGERAVETVLAAVAVHAGQQDLARAATRRLDRPFHGVDAGCGAAAVHVDLPLVGVAGHLLRVDGAQDGLRAERRGGVGDELRVVHRRAVDRHLVGAGGDHAADVGDAAETAAHAVRQMQLRAGAACKVDRGLALVAGGGDVKEDHLVGALFVVALRQLDGVARIAQVHEVDPLHHTAVLHVHAGDHAFCQHISAPQRLGKREIDGKAPAGAAQDRAASRADARSARLHRETDDARRL